MPLCFRVHRGVFMGISSAKPHKALVGGLLLLEAIHEGLAEENLFIAMETAQKGNLVIEREYLVRHFAEFEVF